MQKMQVKINQLGVLFCTIFFLTSQTLLGENAPLLKSPKVDNPKSVLFIGNSFFYYNNGCLLYTSPSPRDATLSRMPSSA